MNKNRKKFLAIGLILLILVLGVASVFVAMRISSQKAVAPTAPTSRPQAAVPTVTIVAECGKCTALTKKCDTGLTCDTVDGLCKKTDGSTTCWKGSTACTGNCLVAAAGCIPTEVITCTPDCPTACGLAASTISTCKDSCGNDKTKSCPATAACGTPDLTIVKKAFFNETTNTAGNYTLKTEIDSVSKDETFVYAIYIENVGDTAATNVVVSDTLDGQKQDLLTFVDAQSGCTYADATKKITCSGISLAPDAKGTYAFRVKVTGNAVNGDVIKNTAKVTYGEVTKEAKKDLTVSTIVGCNNTCANDDECDGSLICDSETKMCRNASCTSRTNCTCITATATATATATVTAAPTLATCNRACSADDDCASGLICDPASSMCRNAACTTKTNCSCVTATVEPTILPETGILDIPGVMAFGGGLLLAVVGILLAL